MKECIDYFKWLILDEIVKEDGWVAGGAVRDFFCKGKALGDIDIFSSSRQGLSNILKRLRCKKAKFLHGHKNCIFLKYKGLKIDVVKRIFKDEKETIDNFDFTVCCGAVSINKVTLHETFLIDLSMRRLIINKLPFPLSSLQRLRKYLSYGFTICDLGLLTIAKSLSTVDFNNPNENTFTFYPNGSVRFTRID